MPEAIPGEFIIQEGKIMSSGFRDWQVKGPEFEIAADEARGDLQFQYFEQCPPACLGLGLLGVALL